MPWFVRTSSILKEYLVREFLFSSKHLSQNNRFGYIGVFSFKQIATIWNIRVLSSYI